MHGSKASRSPTGGVQKEKDTTRYPFSLCHNYFLKYNDQFQLFLLVLYSDGETPVVCLKTDEKYIGLENRLSL